MKKYLIILCIVCMQSCARSFILNNNPAQGFISSPSITIDSTYHYYIRELYSSEEGDKLKQQGNLSDFTNPQRKLIEVEYLFVSNQHHNVIYFSTIPDKYRRYYAERSMGEYFVNVYDLKNISFGKINVEGEFYFTTKKEKKIEVDAWAVGYHQEKGDNYLLIKTISQQIRGTFENMIPVGPALEKELNFKEVIQFSIVFRPRYNDDTAYLVNNRVFINTHDKDNAVHFHFDKAINMKKASGTEVYFNCKRMPFKPDDLFD